MGCGLIRAPGWGQGLAPLAGRHGVGGGRVFGPVGLALPDLGLMPMRDAETGEQLLIDTADAGFRQRFATLAAARQTQLRQALGRCGVDTLELSTTDDLAQALLRFTELRKRRSQRLPVHLKAMPA